MYISVISTTTFTTQSDRVSSYKIKTTNAEIIENMWTNDKIKIDAEITPEYYNDYTTIDDNSNFRNGYDYPVERIYIDVEEPENSYLEVLNNHKEIVRFDLLCRKGTIFTVDENGNMIEKELDFDSAYLTDLSIGNTEIYMDDTELAYYKSIYNEPEQPDQFIEDDKNGKAINNNNCIYRALETSNKNKRMMKASIKEFYTAKLFRHGSVALCLLTMLIKETPLMTLIQSSTVASILYPLLVLGMGIFVIIIFIATGGILGESWEEHL